MLRLSLCAALGLLVCAAASSGQDKDKDKDKVEGHKPCRVAGEITKVGPDHFIVKDSGGKLHHVCCSRECKITQGDKRLTCKDLKRGMRVSVAGHEACHCEGGRPDREEKPCKVEGVVTLVSPDHHHFVVKDAGGMLHHVCCGEGCKIAAGNRTITCKDVKVGLKVRLAGHEACHCETVRVAPRKAPGK